MSSILDDLGVMSVGELAVSDARQLLGEATYEFRSELCDPPRKVNCSMLVWWVFSLRGIEMPRVSRQLFRDLLYLGEIVSPDSLEIGGWSQRKVSR
jgi:cell wall-associated NlpC family hydrolase